MRKKRIKLEKEFLEFIELCNKHEVKYLIIGGYAVSVYGYVRNTKDIDISIEVSQNNANKISGNK